MAMVIELLRNSEEKLGDKIPSVIYRGDHSSLLFDTNWLTV